MKRATLILCVCVLCPIWSFASHSPEKIRTKDFSVYVRNGDRGLQFKMGMEKEVSNSPDWYSYRLGKIEQEETSTEDFDVQKIELITENDVQKLSCNLTHKLLPLNVSIYFSGYGKTGTVTQYVTLENTGNHPIHLENISSIAGVFPADSYEYTYMSSSWSNERRLHTFPLSNEPFSILSKCGRSSNEYSPWLCVKNVNRDIYYIVQLAWSGNWYLKLYQDKSRLLHLIMGEYFDNGFLVLLPGEKVELPQTAISAAYGSIDYAANNLHRYQRDFLLKKQPDNLPLLVQFNSWFPLQQTVTAENLLPYIDKAHELGCESFTIDAGWFTKKSWDREAGDWQTNRKTFPNGLGPIANYVHSKGMKFGLWFELESLGDQSDMLKQHPDWCLQYKGKPVMTGNRAHLDYSKPEVFQWALEQFGKMYAECEGIDWVKLDYNISIGSNFETSDGIKTGKSLRNHILAYYNWLDTLQAHYPNLFIENCSSGAMRLDLGIARHTHTSFISDETTPNPSLGMAWSATLEYLPRAVNHWVVGMGNHYAVIDQSLPKEYWDFMFKVPMNGQYGISSKILEWEPDLWQCALDNIKLYKRIRSIIADADCYHLTPQPDYVDPQGWVAIQYVDPDSENSVLMAYRTRCIEQDYTAKLQALDPSGRYKVSIDGVYQKTYKGEDLMKIGLRLSLDNEYRACVIELYKQ